MADVGIFYGHLVHFTVFCYILWTFGIVHVDLGIFFPFWYFVPSKIWQPCCLHISLAAFSGRNSPVCT
jgi:hypothetical protein